MIVYYTYDAWGKCKVTNCTTVPTAVANNPYRYRGYYYDSDLGMYYLQSRYYDANICRFINADTFVSTGQGLLGYNMFAYCNNNPITYVDRTGNFPWFAIIVIVVSAVVGGVIGSKVAENVEEERQTQQSKITEDDPLNDTAIDTSNEEYTMPTMEKIGYIAAGTLLGTAFGGAVVSLSGVLGSFIVGSPYEEIWFFSKMTGRQTVAIGLLANNISFTLLMPFTKIDMDLPELPNGKFNFNNPYIP